MSVSWRKKEKKGIINCTRNVYPNIIDSQTETVVRTDILSQPEQNN